MAPMELDICLRDFLNMDTFPTDLDAKFIDSFTELYLPIDIDGLCQLETYCRGPAKNSEVLLAFYIEILRKMAKHNGASAFGFSTVMDFLRQNEALLLHTGSAILKQLVFELLSDMEAVHMAHPFKFDLDSKILELLSADRTNIYVRRAVEDLAIVRLRNVRKLENNSYLLWNLLDCLLETDYHIMMDSIARVLLEFARHLTAEQCEKLVQKAKSTRKMGLQFARLVAEIISGPAYGTLTLVSHGFCDLFTHTVAVSQLVECNRIRKKFADAELLDLLVNVAGDRLNYIAPHLESISFSSKQNAQEFVKTLIDSLRSSRLCSDANVGVFASFLRNVDEEMSLFPLVFDALKDRILKKPSLLEFFADNLPQDGPVSSSTSPFATYDKVFASAKLQRIFSDEIKRVLIDEQDGVGWEERDSALELCGMCMTYVDCDVVVLQEHIFRLASSDESEFVRSSATKCLRKMRSSLPADMLTELDKLEEVEEEGCQPASAQQRNIQEEIEDIITTLQNNCGMDDCVSKECY